MNIKDPQKRFILKKLLDTPSREALLRLISWLDKECLKASNLTSIYRQILARAVIAIGYKVFSEGKMPETCIQTIKSGENYALDPTETNWVAFTSSATMSYPFGPGDGCFSIERFEKTNNLSCKPGSGCSSGAGSLASTSNGLNEIEIMQAIAAELVPWIRDNDDPIVSRQKRI